MKSTIFTTVFVLLSLGLFAQVSINTDGIDPDASAMLDVKSTSKGFLPPRMTSEEIMAIPNPAEGLIAYNSTTNSPVFYDGSSWLNFDKTAMLSVGDYFGGGVIFYLDGSGGGLICAVSDQDGETGIQWYNGSYITIGAQEQQLEPDRPIQRQ